MKTTGQIAFEEWVAACAATGVTVHPDQWDLILDDERYQWQRVANAVVEAVFHTQPVVK